jgi:ribosomal protein L37AE/L43A
MHRKGEPVTLYCITNTMDDQRSCTVKGQHELVCDGFEYKWGVEKQQEFATGRECRGCMPREARHGLLCWDCWETVQTAIGGYDLLAARLAGVDRAIVRDNGGVRTASLGSIPIPAVRLMLQELEHYLVGQNVNPDLWVASPSGARCAIRFGRAYANAIRNHPTEESAHRIRRTRCPNCNQLALVWNPVAAEGGDVTVKCRNCAHEIDQASFEKIAAIEKPDTEVPAEVLIEAGQAVNSTGLFAEDFDPDNPEHVALVEDPA